MAMAIILVCLLILSLAWANGANDVAKGVATLAGSGAANGRRAILWGSFCTLLGGLAAVAWGSALLKNFSGGYLAAGFTVDLAFIAAVMVGAAGWVVLSTRLGFPVSTTHALLGGVVGAALAAAGPAGLKLGAVMNKAFLPLLISPLMALLFCLFLLFVMKQVDKRIPGWRPGCCPEEAWRKDPFVCAPQGQRGSRASERLWIGLHWLSGGIISFARGLNDVPKIAAFLILTLALAPGLVTIDSQWLIVVVVLVMTLGSLWGGFRVLEVLAHRVTPLDHGNALAANAGTSLLVLFATPLGLPVSTTHVSTGSLFGVRVNQGKAPSQGDALKMILLAWLVTLPVAAIVAAVSLGLFKSIWS